MNDNGDPRELDLRKDARGSFLKVLMREHIGGSREFGEIYVTTAYPGHVRGNHLHRVATEWFCVVVGRGRLMTENLATGERREIILDAQNPHTVQVNPGIAHAVQNVGEGPMLLLAYADQPYDAAQPDEVRRILIEPHAI
jgi:dTDP-4-dehydrorhamnose 3,5-epimerase-like enzyme